MKKKKLKKNIHINIESLCNVFEFSVWDDISMAKQFIDADVYNTRVLTSQQSGIYTTQAF